MTLKQMRDLVQNQLGLQDVSSYSELGLINLQLNQGVIDILARTRCVVRCINLTTIANQDEYLLDHALMSLVDVENGASRRQRRDETDDGFTLIRADVLRINPTP